MKTLTKKPFYILCVIIDCTSLAPFFPPDSNSTSQLLSKKEEKKRSVKRLYPAYTQTTATARSKLRNRLQTTFGHSPKFPSSDWWARRRFRCISFKKRQCLYLLLHTAGLGQNWLTPSSFYFWLLFVFCRAKAVMVLCVFRSVQTPSLVVMKEASFLAKATACWTTLVNILVWNWCPCCLKLMSFLTRLVLGSKHPCPPQPNYWAYF